MSGVLITGTNTGVGKSVVCGHLARYLLDCDWDVITQKWVQTGCQKQSEDLRLHDEICHGDAERQPADITGVRSPYIFELPASPHLSAARENAFIDPSTIIEAYQRLEDEHDIVLVEGAGGLHVPLNEHTLLVDLATQLNLPAVVVVENTLGCINHSLLTLEALRTRGIPIVGLIFNQTSPQQSDLITRDNPRIICKIGRTTSLGHIPYLDDMNLLPDRFADIGRAFVREYRKEVDNEYMD